MRTICCSLPQNVVDSISKTRVNIFMNSILFVSQCAALLGYLVKLTFARLIFPALSWLYTKIAKVRSCLNWLSQIFAVMECSVCIYSDTRLSLTLS